MGITKNDLKQLSVAVNENLKRHGSELFIALDFENNGVTISEATADQLARYCNNRGILHTCSNKEAYRLLQGMNKTLMFLSQKSATWQR